MSAAWEDEEPTETPWSNPDAWRGDLHSEATHQWLSDEPTFSFESSEFPPILDEDFLLEEDDWCPGGWLDEWGDHGSEG